MFWRGYIPDVAFSISFPITSRINLATNSFRSQLHAPWFPSSFTGSGITKHIYRCLLWDDCGENYKTTLWRRQHNNESCACKSHSQSVRPSPSSWIAEPSCHDYPPTSSGPDTGYWSVYNSLPKFSGKPLYRTWVQCFNCISRSNGACSYVSGQPSWNIAIEESY